VDSCLAKSSVSEQVRRLVSLCKGAFLSAAAFAFAYSLFRKINRKFKADTISQLGFKIVFLGFPVRKTGNLALTAFWNIELGANLRDADVYGVCINEVPSFKYLKGGNLPVGAPKTVAITGMAGSNLDGNKVQGFYFWQKSFSAAWLHEKPKMLLTRFLKGESIINRALRKLSAISGISLAECFFSEFTANSLLFIIA